MESCVSNPQIKQDQLTEEEIFDLQNNDLNPRWGGLKPFLLDGKWGFMTKDSTIVIASIYDRIKMRESYGENPGILIVQKDDQWGVIDLQGRELIPFIYEDLSYSYYVKYIDFTILPFVIAKINKKLGLLDNNNDFLLQPIYDSIAAKPFCNNWTFLKANDKYGFFSFGWDIKAFVFEPAYDEVVNRDCFLLKVKNDGNEGLVDLVSKKTYPTNYDFIESETKSHTAIVRLNNKWGVVDTSGKEVFPIRYDKIASYIILSDSGSYARVQLNNKWGEVDTQGREFIPIIYDQILPNQFVCCYAVRIGDKYGVIDRKNGKELLAVKYEDLSRDYSGQIYPSAPPTKAKLNGKWGYIDSTGKEATPFKYDAIDHAYFYLIPVNVSGNWGFIDRSGKEITPLKYDEIELQSYRLFACRIGSKWGIVDLFGKEITSFVYDKIQTYDITLSSFPEKRIVEIAVLQNEQWGFLDTTGKVSITPKYKFDEIQPFQEGLAAVKREGYWGYINKEGKMVVPAEYDEVTGFFYNGRTGVSRNEKWGIVDKRGRILEPMEEGYDLLWREIDPSFDECGN
jgi:hypothetical protein